MDTKEVQEKLQKAYQSMLEHVEELVDKEKKPLKQAITEAEEKLSEWRELTREEVEHISEELKSNLAEMGEVTHKLNQSIKQTLSFDASYLADSIWSKLSKLADHTALELSEFNEELKQHMSGDAESYSEQQQNWFSDAMQWQGDYEAALKKLDQVRAEVRKQIRETAKYSKAILNEKTDQAQHDLFAQKNQEIVKAIDELYSKVKGKD